MHTFQVCTALTEWQLTVLSSHLNFNSAPENKQNFSKQKYSTQPQLETAFNAVRS